MKKSEKEYTMLTNPRTSWMTDELFKELKKIPINEDFSRRNHYPYLYGPVSNQQYQVRAHDPAINRSKKICTCKDINEAANIVMLIAQQFVEIENQILKMRKAMNFDSSS